MIQIAYNANVHSLQPEMQPVLKAHERIWREAELENRHITSARDGEHGPASWHYFGLAVDFRTWDNHDVQLSDSVKQALAAELRKELKQYSNFYQVIVESTHIHVEYEWVDARS